MRAPNLAELADSFLKLEVIISIYFFKFLKLYLLLTHVPLPWNKTQHSSRVVCSWSTWKSCIQRIEECLSGWYPLHCETLRLNCYQQLLQCACLVVSFIRSLLCMIIGFGALEFHQLFSDMLLKLIHSIYEQICLHLYGKNVICHNLMSSCNFNVIYVTINTTYCTLWWMKPQSSPHVSWAMAFCVRKTTFSCTGSTHFNGWLILTIVLVKLSPM